MLAARLLLLLALASVVSGEHYYVWTQTSSTDDGGAWGFLNFYPKALTINPGDSVTVLQNNDAGIIAITNNTNVPLSPFFPPGPSNLCQPSQDPITARCVAMTHLSFPQTGGPLGNATEGLTHVDFVGTPFPDYSAGFLAAPGIYDEGSFQPPSQWTFYFDPAILNGISGELRLIMWEVLHGMRFELTIIDDTSAPATPAFANETAIAQMDADKASVSALYDELVTPLNRPTFNETYMAWNVYLGVQASQPNGEGYGLGSFDRFIPYNSTTKKSVMHINMNDTIRFMQITPHPHAVSIYSPTNPFPDNEIQRNTTMGTLVEPLTHFSPKPFPDHGLQVWDGTGQVVTGPMLAPGTQMDVRFDVPPGNYYYFCVFHEAVLMEGEIIVHGPDDPTPYCGGTPYRCSSQMLSSSFALLLLLALLAAYLF